MNKPFIISLLGLACLGAFVLAILPDIALWLLLFGSLP
jgi:hypothetical protein